MLVTPLDSIKVPIIARILWRLTLANEEFLRMRAYRTMLSAPSMYQLGILGLYDPILRQKLDRLVACAISEGFNSSAVLGESCSGHF